METQQRGRGAVLVACPDARPPAYQAVIGLDRAGLLDAFVTATYYDPDGRAGQLGPAPRSRPVRPDRDASCSAATTPRSPPIACVAVPTFDLVVPARGPRRRPVADAQAHCSRRSRTERFDRPARPARGTIAARRRCSSSATSARSVTLPALPAAGHPDRPQHGPRRRPRGGRGPRATRPSASPEFFPIYLGDGALDRDELDWLHGRRLRDLELADRVLVPSEHIAETLVSHGTLPRAIRVIPYAADCRRFRPLAGKRHESSCTFLFAGGITPAQGDQVPARGLASGSAGPAGGSSCSGPCPANPGPLRPYARRGRTPGPGRPRRDARPDGRGRRLRVPVALRGLGRRDLRGAGLRPAERRHARARARSSATASRASWSPRATSTNWPADGTARQLDPRSGPRMAAAARARALAFDWPRYHDAVAARSEAGRGSSAFRLRPRIPVIRSDRTRTPDSDADSETSCRIQWSWNRRSPYDPRVDLRRVSAISEAGRVMDDRFYIFATAGRDPGLLPGPGRSRAGSTRSRRSGCSWSATCRSTSSRRSRYHDWAVAIRGKDLVTAANFRAFWAVALVSGRLPPRGSAVGSPRRCLGRPRGWSPAWSPRSARPWSLWGLCSARDHDQGRDPGGRSRCRPRRSLFRSFPFVMMVAAILLIVTGRTSPCPGRSSSRRA